MKHVSGTSNFVFTFCEFVFVLLLLQLLLCTGKSFTNDINSVSSPRSPSSSLSAFSKLPTTVYGHGSKKHRRLHRKDLIGVDKTDDDNQRYKLLLHQPDYNTLQIFSTEENSQNSNLQQQQATKKQHSKCVSVSTHFNGTIDLQTTQSSPTNLQSDEVIPVEGLFGTYSLPSGQLWVFVADSDLVYEAPPLLFSGSANTYDDDSVTKTSARQKQQQQEQQQRPSKQPWWSIRRVSKLYVVYLPRPLFQLTKTQRQEERRQLSLWRHALKEHEWYYSPLQRQYDSHGFFIADFTHNIQKSLQHYIKEKSQSTSSSSSSLTFNNETIAVDAVQQVHQPKYSWWQSAIDESNSHMLQPDSRFFWNRLALQPLLDEYVEHNDNGKTAAKVLLDSAIPVTSAFCGVQRNILINKNGDSSSCCYDHILISRRSRLRAGTRFTRRGADHTGAVANYAETEQIILLHSNDESIENNNKNSGVLRWIASHVQTRGSIPLRWSSPTDIKTYRPRVRIGTDPIAQARAVRQHMVDQGSRFLETKDIVNDQIDTLVIKRKHPSIVLVDLVDKKSDQGRLGKSFDNVLNAVLDIYNDANQTDLFWLNKDAIKHVWFDFHAEVKDGRWDKLKDLLETVSPSLLEHGYFSAEPVTVNNTCSFVVHKVQNGVVRTNCMDCLDRTNVVQNIFGRFMLFDQIRDWNSSAIPMSNKIAFRKNPLELPWSAGEKAHRYLWADNADAISRLYAGTPALKGDFTRTGKRTRRGTFDDGMNSLQRYYLNNFIDADRQEGIDLLVLEEPFNFLDDHEENDNSADEEGASMSLGEGGMTIKEAARKILLGESMDDSESDDESSFVRLKMKNQPHWVPFGGASRANRRPLDLLWLPGDLRLQLLGTELTDTWQSDKWYSILDAIDRRASSSYPWWIDKSSDTGSMSTAVGDDERSTSSLTSSTITLNERVTYTRAGFLLCTLLTGMQMPVAMAYTAFCIACVSFVCGLL